MRTLDEIKKQPRLMIRETGPDGGSGIILFGKIQASVIFSWGAGWDHVSVAPFDWSYTPGWQDMCQTKDTFFYPEETVLQYHPAKSQYVNSVGNCLHLWKPQRYAIPCPPTVLVGKRPGQTQADIRRELAAAFENPYAITSETILAAANGQKRR